MSFAIGENVGRYRIVEQLGQGGMATVYRAYDAGLDREVAIKVMHQAFREDPNFLARFQREAQIVAKLRHPHIVAIYEFAEHNSQPYLVMEFIQGQTLKARLQQRTLELDEITRIIQAVSEALTYAHDQGVLHRDIKPSNILLDEKDIPYLTDFGLARMVQAGESTLSQDMLLGTPQYISPEQAQGKRELGPATDIYALGIVLYRLLVGRVPFSADTPYAIIHDHIYKPLPLPTQINPNVPPAVEQVLLKALAKEPEDRYQSALEMAKAFEESLNNTELPSPKTPPQHAAAPPPAQAPQPAPTPTPQPVIPQPTPSAYTSGALSPSTGVSVSQAKKRIQSRGTLWMIGGLSVFIFTCILGLFIAIAAISDPDLKPPTNDAPPGMMEPLQDNAQTPAFEIPNMSVQEALAEVESMPQSPEAYFALALALFEAGEPEEAISALHEGRTRAEHNPGLIIAAVEQIAERGYRIEALELLIDTLGDNDSPELRNYALAFMYFFASDATLPETLVLRRIATNWEENPNIRAVLAKAYIVNERYDSAERTILSALEMDSTLPLGHLVLGELHAASDNSEDAIAEWQYAATAADAPEWIVERANTLLEEAQTR